jgi:hypothetical protein
MKARVGDRLRVLGRHVGDPRLGAEILEVRGAEGAPPYVIRWDDGHEATFFPGPDVVVEPARRRRGPQKNAS